MKESVHIALVGNPNSGKSSLFNALTGLKQRVGNFPGVTVDKKTGAARISESVHAKVIDLPGTYSLYPKKEDEWVSYRVLIDQDIKNRADLIVLVADASNLKRNLLFCSQIIDLKKPMVIALTMMDIAAKNKTNVDIAGLERELGVLIVPVNPRKGKGISQLKKAIDQTLKHSEAKASRDFIDVKSLAPQAVSEVQQLVPGSSNYHAIHYLINHENFNLRDDQQESIERVEQHYNFNHAKTQAEEILRRYGRINEIMKQTVAVEDPLKKEMFTHRLDNILLHRFWGYLIMLAVLFVIFQSIFVFAQFPMDGIEWTFAKAGSWLSGILPTGWLTDLFINGILAGLSGIVVFVPQIMILFGLITLLEDTGYMARISFLTDKVMRKAGLNGKSVMPMISGLACAVPAIMSARSIENKKERLLTIMVTPLMSCSARLPVYTVLIALVIPNKLFLGFISLQGLVMMLMYFLGTFMALAAAYVMKWFIRSKEKSYFILELPLYRGPRWKNIFHTMVEKAKIFVVDAGKVIMVISLILWALSSYGPKQKMQAVTAKYDQLISADPANTQEYENERQTAYLENSFAGRLGHAIEPVIHPLGYDWKIGIALITSFAAREVFVGTMATLYSVGSDADENSLTLREKMSAATWSDGSKVYTLAAGLSLLVFYALAMQCMSTLAIVRRETKSWKWPLIMLLYMTLLAYSTSFITYQLFS
ncbi:MAG: ferrous iron transport protein B [Chitinophagaceae bacterium]|nr:ferrous iron transport protein B [Chitinophagaceae bacterium]MCW5915039.1 ferrous iron transport protein B [Chitinophagaceae bacterium]MCZ2396690.1 ferrous iron transport protein B [Chitinophagales bacterium]